MRGLVLAVVSLFAVAALTAQSAAPADQARAAWRYRRDVVSPAGEAGTFIAVPLPPEIGAQSQPGLHDLRLVAADGREVPFVVLEDLPRAEERRVAGTLAETRRERREISSWTADLGRVVTFDRLDLEIPGREFSKRVLLEGSIDGTTWTVLGEVWLFDRPWQGRQVHGTSTAVPGTTARFVRVTADDSRSAPITVTGLTAVLRRGLAGSRWNLSAPLVLDRRADGRSRYRAAVPDGVMTSRIEIDADDAAFARPVNVIVSDDGAERIVGQGTVYRLQLPDGDQSVESRQVDVVNQAKGGLIVEIVDGDTPPLVNPRVVLSGPQTLLVAAPPSATSTLYYGNRVTRRVSYDLERLRPQLLAAAELPTASLGEEVANPSYSPPVPLSFMTPRGAELDAGRWTFVRPLRIEGSEDLYSLTMTPVDLARGRRDLADLRLIDTASRQVPYIVERDVETASVPLRMTPATPRVPRSNTSAFSLTPSAPDESGPVVISAIELQVAEGYFQRIATMLAPDPGGVKGLRVVGTATIASSIADGGTAGAIVRLPVRPIAAAGLVVEIENRDNAPLTVRSAAGLTTVPRITFKAGRGEYRLLLGNDGAGAPSYELEALRRDVLAYAAVPVPATWLDAAAGNPDRVRTMTDVVRDAPPTVVLWSAFGVAIVVLLALTRRILRAGPAPDSD